MVSLVAFGGGTDSTAMLIEMVKRGEPAPHAILFADTGGEHPHTYRHIWTFSEWLMERGYPAVTIVSVPGETLEEDCLRRETLPGIAFGFKSCSDHFKIRPQKKWRKDNPVVSMYREYGEPIVSMVGFEWGEEYRAQPSGDRLVINRFPLIEWEMDRDACKASILAAGIRLPGKSSCFFCPNMKRWEIKALADTYPELIERALAMEDNAAPNLTQIKGLGRNYSWRAFIENRVNSPELPMEMPCECYDGAAE